MRLAQTHLSGLSKSLWDGIPSLQYVDCTKQLGVVSKLAESVLNATDNVAKKDDKQCWSQSRPLRNTTHCWAPLQAIDHNTANVSIPLIPSPLHGPSIKPMSLQFSDKDVTQESVKHWSNASHFEQEAGWTRQPL
ncbi:hypothetical protein HGM15179_001364 [Zosterops borbonicus]|uniref:Uncharacterized protein n=1 Tax=Zosterops borbonicus TaxID=364589 RepID=A0A8K1GX74_9PASS|nr:hypothetical protein HGM15179_001364 [Zosterops borbonicus]